MKSIKILETKKVPVNKIDIQYRMRSDVRKKIDRLKKSIKGIGGLVQPPVVFQKKDGRFGLIAGTRRLEAYKELNKEKIPILLIEKVDDITASLISLIENLQRVDPPPDDIRVACSDLARKFIKKDMSQKDVISEIQNRLGVTKRTAKKYLALTLVPEEVREMVTKGKISKKDVQRVYASTEDESKMIKIAEFVRDGELTREQQEVVPEIVEENPDISIDVLPEKTRERARKTLKIWFPFEEFDRIEKACEVIDVDPEALVRIATIDWLERHEH